MAAIEEAHSRREAEQLAAAAQTTTESLSAPEVVPDRIDTARAERETASQAINYRVREESKTPEISVEAANEIIDGDANPEDLVAALDRIFAPVEAGSDDEDTRSKEILFESDEVDESLEFNEGGNVQSEPQNEANGEFNDANSDEEPENEPEVTAADETEHESDASVATDEEDVAAETAVNQGDGTPPPARRKKKRRFRIWPWSRRQVVDEDSETVVDGPDDAQDDEKVANAAEDELERKNEHKDSRRGRHNSRGGRRRSKKSDRTNGSTADNTSSTHDSEEGEGGASSRDRSSRKRQSRGRHRRRGGRDRNDTPSEEIIRDDVEDTTEKDQKPRRKRGNIPTWDTAVSYVVDKNVKARGNSIPKRERIKKKRRDNKRGELVDKPSTSDEQEAADAEHRDSKRSGKDRKRGRGRTNRNRRDRGKPRENQDAQHNVDKKPSERSHKNHDGADLKNAESGQQKKHRRRRRSSGDRKRANESRRPEKDAHEEVKSKKESKANESETKSAGKKPDRRRRRRSRTDRDEK